MSLPGETRSPLGSPDLDWPALPTRILEWPSFSLGMDYTTPDGKLQQGALRLAENVLLSSPGELIYPGGPNPTAITSGSLEVYDFIRYRRDPDSLVGGTGFDAWVYIRNNSGTKQFCWTSTGGVVTVLGTVQANSVFHSSVLQIGRRAIGTSVDNLPVVWYGTGAMTTLGHSAPTDAPTALADAAGVLDTTGFADFQYAVSFVDIFGNETNPTPLSAGVAAASNSIHVIIAKSMLTPTGMAEANLKTIHIWRIGGKSDVLRLAYTINSPVTYLTNYFGDPAIGGGHALDNTPEGNLPDIFPSYANLPPPRGLLTLKEHQGRLFGAGQSTNATIAAELGSSSRLWFSRPYMPESWGFEDDGVDDDGGFLDIDDNPADPIVTLESTGSVLVIGRRQSVYTLFGSGFTTFRFDKRSDFGLPSRRAMCRRGNSVVWLGSDYKVYELGDRDPINIGKPIEKYLRDATVDITKAVLFVHDKRLHLSIPKGSGVGAICLVLEEETGGWTVLTDRFDVNSAKSINLPGGLIPVCMTAPRLGSSIVQEYYYVLDNQTADAPYHTVDIETDRIRIGTGADQGKVLEVYLDLVYVGALTLTIDAEGSTQDYAFNHVAFAYGNRYGVPLAGIQTPIHLKGLPPKLTGRWVSLRLTGSVQAFHLREMYVVVGSARGSR